MSGSSKPRRCGRFKSSEVVAADCATAPLFLFSRIAAERIIRGFFFSKALDRHQDALARSIACLVFPGNSD